MGGARSARSATKHKAIIYNENLAKTKHLCLFEVYKPLKLGPGKHKIQVKSINFKKCFISMYENARHWFT